MSFSFIKAVFFAIILLLAQAMMLNNIHLFGCATPLMLVYLVMLIPTSYPRWSPMVIGFLIGIVSDMFTNTPGVAAASMTLIGLIQPALLHLLVSEESNTETKPSFKTLGFTKFAGYTAILVLVYCISFFGLEHFSLYHLQQWLLYIIGSSLLTILLILTVESLRKG